MTIAHNLERVYENVARACTRSGRAPESITLVAVSKTHPAEHVLEAAACGLQHFGENRVEEAEIKIPLVSAQLSIPVTWHMIGHIQSRKAREVAFLFQWVHSVDTSKLATRLSNFSVEQGKRLPVMLEMNVSGEEAKYGLQASGWNEDPSIREQLWNEVRQIIELPGLEIRGLMTMAPIVDTMEQARPVFRSLAQLRSALVESFGIALPELSMGMTDDYPVAVEEGSTIIRIGRAIFGERES